MRRLNKRPFHLRLLSLQRLGTYDGVRLLDGLDPA